MTNIPSLSSSIGTSPAMQTGDAVSGSLLCFSPKEGDISCPRRRDAPSLTLLMGRTRSLGHGPRQIPPSGSPTPMQAAQHLRSFPDCVPSPSPLETRDGLRAGCCRASAGHHLQSHWKEPLGLVQPIWVQPPQGMS